MTGVTPTEDGFVVDAQILGDGFGLDPARVPELMRAGAITSRSEIGQDTDEGRFRLTFFHGGKGLRLTIDSQGEILGRSSFAVPDREAGKQ